MESVAKPQEENEKKWWDR